jgi:hypothetical protein
MWIRRTEKRTFIVVGTILLVLLTTGRILSQTDIDKAKMFPAPAREKFLDSVGLIVPWRDGSCTHIVFRRDTAGCYTVGAAEYQTRTRMTIYGFDGKLWRTLDVDWRSELYFGNFSKEIVPFATPELAGEPPRNFVMRVVAESPHWWRVIVNEDARAAGYVRKDDPDWFRTSFEYWLKGWRIRLVGNPPLLDQPDGKVAVESHVTMLFGPLEVIKLDKPDGEWIYVRSVDENGKEYFGWIRWREGRKFLVDSYFGALLH